MYNLTVFNQVLIIFIIMLVGIYARKRKIIKSGSTRQLSAILLNITLPLSIVSSFNLTFSKSVMFSIVIVFIFGMLVHPISFLLGKVIFSRCENSKRKVLIFLVTFSNCGFMGYPILENLYGKTGVLYGAVFIATFNIFLWTIGVKIFKERENCEKEPNNILNPGIIAVLIGLLLFVFSIKIPNPLQKSFELIGNMTTPLSMIITGVVIAEIQVKNMLKSPLIVIASFVRLLAIPVAAYFVCSVFHVEETVKGTCTIISGMPAAAMTTVFAERYNGDSLFASQAVFISTILSLITIPMMVLII